MKMIVLNVSALSVHHLSLIRMPNKDREYNEMYANN